MQFFMHLQCDYRKGWTVVMLLFASFSLSGLAGFRKALFG